MRNLGRDIIRQLGLATLMTAAGLALALIAPGALITGGAPRQGQNARMIGATIGVASLLTVSFILRGIIQRTPALAPAFYAMPVLAMACGAWPLLHRPTFLRRAAP